MRQQRVQQQEQKHQRQEPVREQQQVRGQVQELLLSYRKQQGQQQQ
jgi:hypothetical protein